jgi:hypothetical protein
LISCLNCSLGSNPIKNSSLAWLFDSCQEGA